MTITKVTHKDGSESVRVRIATGAPDYRHEVEEISMTEWSRMLANPLTTKET